MRAESVALWCAVPLTVAVALDALEVLVARVQLQERGIYSYTVLVTSHRLLLEGPLAGLLAPVFRYPGVLVLPAVQLGAACVPVAAAVSGASWLVVPAGMATLTILAARMLMHFRNQVGLDGSDQMILVACTSIGAALLLPDPLAKTIALQYLVAQLLLSYAVAGIAKAISPTWRSGRALPGILSTIGYGSPRLGAFLGVHPRISLALCWWVIVFECAAPLMLLGGTVGAWIIIVAGLAFHLSIAVLMGLNTFLWSFAAAYPALLFVADFVDRLWR